MHEQHRDRVRKRFLRDDIDSFEPHQVLELILFYSIPRKDTNEIAHRLMDKFGGFAQVLDAPVEELKRVEGVGEQSALLIKLFRSSYRYYQIQSTSSKIDFGKVSECGQYMMARVNGKKNEEVHLLCLDGQKRLINCLKIDEGSVNAVVLKNDKILRTAIANNASAVVLAHNHPGAVATPSREDVDVTRHLAKVLMNAGISLLDHFILSDCDYVSLVESNLYHPEEFGIYMGR